MQVKNIIFFENNKAMLLIGYPHNIGQTFFFYSILKFLKIEYEIYHMFRYLV